MLIDTHTHLFLEDFDDDREQMMKRAIENDVRYFFLPNIDSSSIESVWSMTKTYPQNCFALMGLHPVSVKDNFESELETIQQQFDERGSANGDQKIYGIGEIGLDLYWDKSWFEQQKEALIYQIRIAKKQKLPIILHSRDSFKELADIIEQEKDESLEGVFHCFTGSVDDAKRVAELGFYMGIGGVATFKNGGLDKTLPSVDLAHLVLETDSPYLAPMPYRGKRNESSYILNIAEKVAEIYGMRVEEVAAVTTKNAMELFSLNPDP